MTQTKPAAIRMPAIVKNTGSGLTGLPVAVSVVAAAAGPDEAEGAGDGAREGAGDGAGDGLADASGAVGAASAGGATVPAESNVLKPSAWTCPAASGWPLLSPAVTEALIGAR